MKYITEMSVGSVTGSATEEMRHSKLDDVENWLTSISSVSLLPCAAYNYLSFLIKTDQMMKRKAVDKLKAIEITCRLLPSGWRERIQKVKFTWSPGSAVKMGLFRMARPASLFALRVRLRKVTPLAGWGTVRIKIRFERSTLQLTEDGLWSNQGLIDPLSKSLDNKNLANRGSNCLGDRSTITLAIEQTNKDASKMNKKFIFEIQLLQLTTDESQLSALKLPFYGSCL